MTVGELIEALSRLDRDLPVIMARRLCDNYCEVHEAFEDLAMRDPADSDGFILSDEMDRASMRVARLFEPPGDPPEEVRPAPRPRN
jgi:hypothetical protein